MKVFRFNNSQSEGERDERLRDKLNDHSVIPPSYIWDNVEENLPRENKRRGIIFWFLPIAACILGLLWFIPYNAMQKNASVAVNKVNSGNSSSDQPINSGIKRENNSAKNNIKSIEKKHFSGEYYIQKQSEISIYKHPKKSLNHIEEISGPRENDFNTVVKEPVNDLPALATNDKKLVLNKPKTLLEKSIDREIIKLINDVQPKKWLLGFEGGIGSSYRTISDFKLLPSDKDSMVPKAQNASSDYNNIEKPALSWRLAVNAAYKISDKWLIKTGLGYTNYSISSIINTETIYRPDPITVYDTVLIQKNSTGDFPYGQLESSSVITTRIVQQQSYSRTNSYPVTFSFHLIEMPLQLRYQKIYKRAGFYAEGGLNLWYLYGKKASYTLSDGTNADVTPGGEYNLFGLGSTAGAGFVMPLGKDILIDAGPVFTTSFTSLKHGDIAVMPYNILGRASVMYKF